MAYPTGCAYGMGGGDGRELMCVLVVHASHYRKRGRMLQPLEPDQILQRLALADDRVAAAVHEHLRYAGAVVVIAAHRKAIRTGGEDGEQIASLRRRQR